MQLAGIEVASRFVDELSRLRDTAKDEEDRAQLEMYVLVNDELAKLLEDIQAEVLKP
jgi:hypothetical protein